MDSSSTKCSWSSKPLSEMMRTPTFGNVCNGVSRPLWRSLPARAVCVHLTDLQLRVGLTQAPVDAAVTVRLLKQLVQHLSGRLPLVHHQRLGAAVTHQHLYYQLGEAANSGLLLSVQLHGEEKHTKTCLTLPSSLWLLSASPEPV